MDVRTDGRAGERLMRALLTHAPGDRRLAELPEPEPGPGEIVIAMKALVVGLGSNGVHRLPLERAAEGFRMQATGGEVLKVLIEI